MLYFVVADDGTKYGPADIATLNSWIQEGRLLPGTLLEEEASGARIAAAAVSGLLFPSAKSTEASGPQGSIYSNPSAAGNAASQNPHSAAFAQSYKAPTDEGNVENIFAWILGVLGLFICCCHCWILAGVGAFLATRAKAKGNRNAQSALVFNIVVLVLGALYTTSILVMGPKFRDQLLKLNQVQQEQLRDRMKQRNQPPAGP